MSIQTRTNHGCVIPLPQRDRCELCGFPIDRADPDGHGLGECVNVCEACCGAGAVPMPHVEYVTREMALDACEPSLEGQPIQTGVEDVTCPNCNGTGGTPMEATA